MSRDFDSEQIKTRAYFWASEKKIKTNSDYKKE